MEPEAFTPRFIATDHGGRVRQTQAAFGVGDLFKHAFLMPRGHSALARLLPMARGEAELPGFFTQFKGYKQGPRCRVLLHMASRCGGHGLSPPWWSIQRLWKRSIPTAARSGNQRTSIVSI